jgi:glycosyltransferase involved in cell wall biosynthesis
MEKRVPMFSVVIPTLNRGPKLLRAVRSVFAQTLKDFEILVVDDGTDDSAALLRQSFGDDVQYLRGAGQGVAGGRNLGIAAARGEYVAFLDADDWWYPGKLQRVADRARLNPDIALFYSKMDIVDAEGRRIRTPPVKKVGRNAYPVVVAGNFIFNSTVVAKRSSLDCAGGFDTVLCGCEDWELWIRVTRHAPSMLIPEALVAYEHLAEGSLSSRYETWIRAHDEVIAKTVAADPTLTSRQLDDIRTGLLYTKASIYLGAGKEALALEDFKQVVSRRWRHWRALVYVVILSWMSLRRSLPNRVKVLLRLPEAHG